MVQYGIRQTTESIQQMTCVERVLQYSNIESVSCWLIFSSSYDPKVTSFFVGSQSEKSRTQGLAMESCDRVQGYVTVVWEI